MFRGRLHFAVSSDKIVLFAENDYERGEHHGKQGAIREQTRIHHAVGGVRDRLRERMEVSVDVRTVRRRQLYACVCDLSADPRPARSDDGVCDRTRGAVFSRAHVS